jgi:hypothetical protein
MKCEMIIYRFIIFAVVSAVFAGRFITKGINTAFSAKIIIWIV